jgi:CTP:molybdopterin cytidylyltransferase MocA
VRSAGVVLAAGGSLRLGHPKQLLDLDGRPLLEVVLAEICASRLDEVVVVLGAEADRIRRAVLFGRTRTIINPGWEEGMSSSLRTGLLDLEALVERAVILLGDQPSVSAAQIDRLLDLHAGSGLPAAALSFDGLLHPPVVLERRLWGELMALEGDIGCRALIRARPELVASLPVPGALRHPIDVDTDEDYRRLLRHRAGSGPASGRA